MLINMIVAFLQHYYKCCLQKKKEVNLPLHVLLMRFFKFYGSSFDNRANGISIREGGFIYGRDRETEFKADMAQGGLRHGPIKISIESPIDPMEEVGTGAFNFLVCREHFRMAYELMYVNGPDSFSLVSHLINEKMFLYKSACQ
mmetsp:Transcript_117653/g.163887  ORF Transcript_117653/g.163887 Transcript_117653/m.163887 type:complete len:144 (+) Transcript_117653:717-1148(+)